MIEATEVIVVSIIKYLIVDSGKSNESTDSFQIMAFLANNIQCTSIDVLNYRSLKTKLAECVQSEGLFKELERLGDITMDDMFDFVETLRNMFVEDSQVSSNSLRGPIRVTQNSFLGIIVRSYIARWESLSFEDSCIVVENVHNFIGNNCKITNCHNDSTFATIAIKALENGDVTATEDAIHCHFDSIEKYSMKSTDQIKVLASELEVLNAKQNKVVTIGRHQMAMLGLATMWTNSLPVGNVHLALSAVEEAMKTAHQRGDHASVAKALLLMYHVAQYSHRSELSSSSHDILLRCISRCIMLKLNDLVCESTALLAQLRSTGVLRLSSYSDDSPTDSTSAGLSLEANAIIWKACDNWSLLMTSLLGVPSLIARQLSSHSQDYVEATTKTPKPLNSAVLTAQQKKDLTADANSNITPSFLSLSIRAGEISHQIWMRLGMLHAAEFNSRQQIKQLLFLSSKQELVKSFVRWMKIKINLINCRLLNNNSSSNSIFYACAPDCHDYHDVIEWIQKVQLVLGTDDIKDENWFKSSFLSCLLFARIHECISEGQWSKALRLCYRYVDVSSQGYEESISVGQSSVTEEWLDAKLLLAKIVSQSNYNSGQELLIDLEDICSKCNFAALQLDAQIARYSFMYQFEESMKSSSGIHLQRLFVQSLSQNFTTITFILSSRYLSSSFV